MSKRPEKWPLHSGQLSHVAVLSLVAETGKCRCATSVWINEKSLDWLRRLMMADVCVQLSIQQRGLFVVAEVINFWFCWLIEILLQPDMIRSRIRPDPVQDKT